MQKYLSSPEEAKLPTILHAIFGYFFLLLVVRVLSRRPGGQLTLFEFVIVFLIGGVIILSTVGKDRSVVNCATAILTVGLMHYTVSAIKSRYPSFGACGGWHPAHLSEERRVAVGSDERHAHRSRRRDGGCED